MWCPGDGCADLEIGCRYDIVRRLCQAEPVGGIPCGELKSLAILSKAFAYLKNGMLSNGCEAGSIELKAIIQAIYPCARVDH